MAATRLNKLSTHNPIISQLEDNWRDGQAQKEAPPLPPHNPKSKAKKEKQKTMQLLKIAKLSDARHKRILPYLTPPWRRTAISFGGMIQITTTTIAGEDEQAKKDKKKAAQEHNKKLSTFHNDNEHPVVIYHKKCEVYAESRGLGARAEVYDGEMAGLSLGARAAADYVQKNPQVAHIHFYADNSAAVGTIFDPQPRPCQLYAESFSRKMMEFLDGSLERTVEIAWVPGHCNVKGNDRADVLAKAGVDMGTRMQGTRSNALRRAKEKTLARWTKEWKAEPRRGGFGDANRIKPKAKPTKLFKELSREVFGRLVQCRTGHSYTGEYYKWFHIEEETTCSCGEEIQSREHILRECPKYDSHRHILKEVSKDVALQEILGTKKGIEALAEFIEASGAFTRNSRPFNKEQPLPEYDDKPEPLRGIEDDWASDNEEGEG
jgi:hypothetical protein